MTKQNEPPRPDFTFDLELITPEVAERILARNDRNRVISSATVACYALDMVNGDWMANGETIKIAIGGTLLDGQQRLKAIIEAERPQWMLVVRGLSPNAQATIDNLRPRQFKDMLRIAGVPRYTTVASITRRLAFWELGVRTRGGSGGRRMSNVQLDHVLGGNQDIHFSAEVAETVGRKIRLPISIIGFCHLLFYRVDPDDAAFFFNRLVTGVDLPDGHPILVLQRTLDAIRDDSRLSETMQLAYTIKAWNAYRQGETLSRLTYRPGGSKPEPFPEPK
jgi:hypothetical protein